MFRGGRTNHCILRGGHTHCILRGGRTNQCMIRPGYGSGGDICRGRRVNL
jgi:hypothetical protein